MRIGFDNDKYLQLQTSNIMNRIEEFGGKLYLEIEGKIFDDYHASRVLPGFLPDCKIKLILQFKKYSEMIIAINSNDIEKSKVRDDIGITYSQDVLRLIDMYSSLGMNVNCVVLTQFDNQPSAISFENKLRTLGIKVNKLYRIDNYPSDIKLIVSDDGFGKNDYVETTQPLVLVTAPGAGSGKLAFCLSQLYHEQKMGIRSGYAKFETFPIWNLAVRHPVNFAYEAATVDLNDKNMIDPFHLENHGRLAVTCNRDVEIFPVMKEVFERIYGESPYKSPTDMGINMAGFCITNEEEVREAAKQEVIRRYYKALVNLKNGENKSEELYKLDLIMKQLGIALEYRHCVRPAIDLSKKNGTPAAALELQNGKIILGRTTSLLGACAGLLLNALKELAEIRPQVDIVSPSVIRPLQNLKVNHLGSKNPRLHTNEILYALSFSAASSPTAKKALQALGELKGCELHSTVILSSIDMKTLTGLGINVTCDPNREANFLYNK